MSFPVTSEKATEQSQPLSKSPSNKMGLNFPETMEALGKQRWEDYKDIETKEQGLSKSPRNKQGLNITKTVEKVNQQRMQNLMDIEAKELVGFFKVYVHRSTYNLPYSLSQDTVSMIFFMILNKNAHTCQRSCIAIKFKISSLTQGVYS